MNLCNAEAQICNPLKKLEGIQMRKRNINKWFLLAMFMNVTTLANSDDILIANFEGEDFGDWTVSGEAFGAGPTQGAIFRQKPLSGYLGLGLLNSYDGGEAAPG